MKAEKMIGVSFVLIVAGVYLLRYTNHPSSALMERTKEVGKVKSKTQETGFQHDISQEDLMFPNVPQFSLTKKEFESMFEIPVEFYGQVLDQFDQPVIGAKIRCGPLHYSPTNPDLEFKSQAPNGSFVVSGFRAPAIRVLVYPPEGYYDKDVTVCKDVLIAKTPERVLQNEAYKKLPLLQKEDQILLLMGVGETYKPDKTTPTIFRLKKL